MASQHQSIADPTSEADEQPRFHYVPFAAVVEGGLVGVVLYAMLFVAGSIAAAVAVIAYSFYRSRAPDRAITLDLPFRGLMAVCSGSKSGIQSPFLLFRPAEVERVGEARFASRCSRLCRTDASAVKP